MPMGVPVDVWRSQHNTAKQLSSNKKLDKKPRGNIVTSSVKALRKGLKEDVLPLQTGGDAQTEEPPGLSPLAQFTEPYCLRNVPQQPSPKETLHCFVY